MIREFSRAEIAELNATMPAGSPMVYACVECGFPIWVPECWVIRDKRCPDCGGQWCRAEAEAWLLPGETRESLP